MNKPKTNDIFNDAQPGLAPGRGESCDVTADKLLEYLALRPAYQVCVLSQALGWFPVERDMLVSRLEFNGSHPALLNVERWSYVRGAYSTLSVGGMRLMVKGVDR
jgi:hypothetical protein